MQIATGTYTGTGATKSITGVGFQPNCVFIQRGSNVESMAWATDTMVSGHNLNSVNGDDDTDGITSLDVDGFTVETNTDVNGSGVTYYWAAMLNAVGECITGTYTGNNTNDTDIEGLGFQPDVVFLLEVGGIQSLIYWESAGLGDSTATFYRAEALRANKIQNMIADGFQIGNDGDVNQSAKEYHYIAFKVTAGTIENGSYAATASDPLQVSLADATITPDLLWIRQRSNQDAAVRFASMVGDLSAVPAGAFQTGELVADLIEAMGAGTFDVGQHISVQEGTTDYDYLAIMNVGPSVSGIKGQDFSHQWRW